MKYVSRIITIGSLSFLSLMSCAQLPDKDGQMAGHTTTSVAAVEAEAHNFVEIEFDLGSSKLTENAKTSLHSIIRQAKKAGKIDEVIVLSWADEDYPSKALKQLSPSQRELADRRNTSIKHYMNSVKKVDVDAYNMAENPNTLSRWFNTRDNRLKNSFLAAGLPTTADSPQYATKASHSVILVKVE